MKEMKRIVALLAVCVLLLSCCAAFAEDEYEKPILFRGISWGASYKDAMEALPEGRVFAAYGTNWYKLDDFLRVASAEAAIFAGETLGVAYGGDSTRNSSIGEMKVAGYPIREVYLYFIGQSDSKGHLATDDDHLSLVYASYALDVTQTDAVYEDLLNKLASIYGDVDQHREEEGLLQNLWRGAEGTVVSLVNTKGKVYIRYGFSGADALIETAHQVLNYGEVLVAGSDTDGL